jgi:hypothetical protein
MVIYSCREWKLILRFSNVEKVMGIGKTLKMYEQSQNKGIKTANNERI